MSSVCKVTDRLQSRRGIRSKSISQLRYMKTRMSALQTGSTRFIQSIFEEVDALFFFWQKYKELFTKLIDIDLLCCETNTAKEEALLASAFQWNQLPLAVYSTQPIGRDISLALMLLPLQLKCLTHQPHVYYRLNIKRRLIKVASIAMETKNKHKKAIKIAHLIIQQVSPIHLHNKLI